MTDGRKNLKKLSEVEKIIKKSFLPVVRMRLDEWADKYRIVPPGKAEPGPWNTSRVEPWRYIYELYSDIRVREINVMGATQTSKSEFQTNAILHAMDINPKSILLVKSSGPNVKTYVKDNLNPSISLIPRIKRSLQGGDDGDNSDASDTNDHKRYKGEWIFIGTAGSKNTFLERNAAVGILDELDAYEQNIQNEGDPIVNFRRRLENNYDYKMIVMSKPVLKKTSHTYAFYQQKKRHVWMWFCPHCHELFEFDFESQMICTEENDPSSAVLVCPHCKGHIKESQRVAASYNGVWKDLDPHKSLRGVSFQMNALMFPWTTFESAMEGYINSRGNTNREQAFANNILGLPYEPEALEKLDTASLKTRNSKKYKAEIPMDCCILTCGIDVQQKAQKGFVLHWMAWADGNRGYSVGVKKIAGSLKSKETWEKLEHELIFRQFKHERRFKKGTDFFVIDTGHETQKVYQFLYRMRNIRGAMILGYKGVPGWDKPIFKPSKGRVGLAQLIDIHLFASWRLQRELYERYSIPVGDENSICFPKDNEAYDDEFFKDLIAYRLYSKQIGAYEQNYWDIGKREHDFNDTLKMQIGAMQAINPSYEYFYHEMIRQSKLKDDQWIHEEDKEIEEEENGDLNINSSDWMENYGVKSLWI